MLACRVFLPRDALEMVTLHWITSLWENACPSRHGRHRVCTVRRAAARLFPSAASRGAHRPSQAAVTVGVAECSGRRS
jgi:hypothetical protein